MTETAFLPVFFGVWLTTVGYIGCVTRLSMRVSQLHSQGQALDAPAVFGAQANPIAGITWLVTGRYARMTDPVCARWGAIARIMFFVTLPLILGMFVWAFLLMPA